MIILTLCMIWLGSDDVRLTDEVGRRQYRVFAEPFPLDSGLDVVAAQVPQRLDRLGYKRVRKRPQEPGQYFWGTDNFYIYNRAFRHGGKDRAPELLQLGLSGGRITSVLVNEKSGDGMLEPELLCESLDQRVATRIDLNIGDVPKNLWRPLLAAEDARFFSHGGLDGRALARSALANLKAGKVKQGGSTITQQLIKGRDLTPKRTFGRKASEAWRALWLEARYSKEEILEAYLNHVYMGHVGGYAIHGYGAAARAYFNKSLDKITVLEAATLGAMVQGPNRLSPFKNPDRVKKRRNWIFDRMVELEWLTAGEATQLKAKPVTAKRGKVEGPDLSWYRAWLRELVATHAPKRAKQEKGVVLETRLDPLLQDLAEDAVDKTGKRLRKRYGSRLQAALICVDARNGAVLAYVGGYPGAKGDSFDRVRKAKRQPGSLVKPFALLEAFDKARGRDPYHGATLVADRQLTVDLPSGPWKPRNNDRKFHGDVPIRQALRHSYNVPFVRLGMHLGEKKVARRMEKAGLKLPETLPPSFLLGAMEATPLEMARAYSVFAEGYRLEPLALSRMEKPSGRKLKRFKPKSKKVADAALAWMVDDLLADSVRYGSGKGAAIKGVKVSGKTGTSSNGRDAWFVGRSGSLLTVVWLGFEKGEGKGLSGGGMAATLYRDFAAKATPLRPEYQPKKPLNVTRVTIDPKSGLRVKKGKAGSMETYVTRTSMPGKKRWWRSARKAEVIR